MKKKHIIFIALTVLICAFAVPSFTFDAIQSMSSHRMTVDAYGQVFATEVMTTNDYVNFETDMANTVAVFHGYSGAEELKSAFGFGAKAMVLKCTSLGEIFV